MSRKSSESKKAPKRRQIKSKTTEVQLDPFFERDPDKLMGERKRPKDWDELPVEQKLEYIATRILAEDRFGVTSHKALKETGILSNSQYERRRNREVYSEFGSLDEIKPNEGQFSRTHVRDLRGYKSVREWERQGNEQPVKTSKIKPSPAKKKTAKKETTKKVATKKAIVKKTTAKKKVTKKKK